MNTWLCDLFEDTSDAIASFEVFGGRYFTLLGINPAGERLLGIRLSEARGQALHELLPPAVVEPMLRRFAHALEAGGPTTSEQCWQLPDGDRWLSVLLVPSRHPGQSPHRLGVIWRDIANQKAYELALAEREEMFRHLVETTNVIPWEADSATGRFTFIGPQAARRFGYPLTDWYEEGFWAEHLHPEDREDALAARAQGAATPSEYELEYRMLTRSGEVVWVHDLVSVLLDRQGRRRLIGFLVDVTARRGAEEEIRRLNAELERRVAERTAQLASANRELEAFCYSVSHDLRAPLRAVDGFSKALLEDYGTTLDDEGRDMLRRVRAASQRMGELIDDLLMLSRVSRSEIRRTHVDLSALAYTIAASLAALAPARSIEWIIASDLTAHGDPALLRVLLENLLGNAWKYTAAQPLARIEFGRLPDAGGRDEFFVRDNGAGFDPAYASKLFQPFQRLHRADEFEGHGIGLATVQRVVHRHGGEVRGEGAVGRGATFYFTL